MYTYTNCVEIAQGAYGSVIRGVQVKEGKPVQLVAIKRLIEKPSDERNFIAQSPQEEVQIMHSISHPHVMKALDYFVEDGYSYIVMPFCPLNVAELIYENATCIPLRVIQCLFYQMMSGLACMHQQNIIHKDLKPRNLLINQYGELVITDFGQSYQKIASAGTRNYRAPEAALNLAYDKPADIFAAGCVLFEIVC